MTNELVFKGENSQALTNSLLVAEKFGKRHGDVIRSIEKLLNTEDETLNAKMRLAFESASYVDSTGKSNLMYVMNRKGFSILVMGYNGVKALRFKDVWHKVYSQLYYLYHISIKSYKKLHNKETKLDIAVRNHFIDKIFTIVSNLVRENKAA